VNGSYIVKMSLSEMSTITSDITGFKVMDPKMRAKALKFFAIVLIFKC